MPRAVPNQREPTLSAILRERILTAAANLFRTQGYDVSMESIALAADVSKQSLYNHFNSKEALFKAIVTARASAIWETLLAPDSDRPVRDVLLQLARQYYGLALSDRGLGFTRMAVSASIRLPETGQVFYESGPLRTLEALAAWVERQERAGQLHTGNPRLAAEHFLSFLVGHQQIRGLLGLGCAMSEPEIEARAQFCVDSFLRSFGVPVNRL